MKKSLPGLLSFILILLSAIHVKAQVTIGSNIPPQGGALLDIKQKDTDTNNATASKGLGLPQVKLTDPANLFPMLETTPGSGVGNSFYNTGALKNDEDAKHIGLVVYNTNKCQPFGAGVFVWTGLKWQKMSDTNPLEIPNISVAGLSGDIINIISGADARGTVIPQLDLSVTLQPAGGATLTPTGSGTSYDNMFSTMPAWSGGAAQSVAASPDSYTLQPLVMTVSDFTGLNSTNPWQNRKWSLVYSVQANDCGAATSRTITLNQTNYALMANGQLVDNTISAVSNPGSFPVRSNGKWITTLSDPDNIIASTTPAIGVIGATDADEGSTSPSTVNFGYTFNNSTKYYTADITFKDSQSPKRLNDLTVSLVNCSGTSEPTMAEWKTRAGLDGYAEGDPHPVSTIAWHYDQSGNIFFSAEFGDDTNSSNGKNRWMITNLAATDFARTDRTGNDNTIITEFAASPYASTSRTVPSWAYPGTSATSSATYDANPRVGRLYNFPAVTNMRGGATVSNTSDGEGDPVPQTAKIQGICPNGWHLPSDAEWAALERELDSHTSEYSSIADANATIPIGVSGTALGNSAVDYYQGTTHGQGMKAPCPASGSSTLSNGASNVMSTTKKAGFDAILAGYASSATSSYGTLGRYWTSSVRWNGTSNLVQYAWYRGFESDKATVNRYIAYWYFSHSVRCKKD